MTQFYYNGITYEIVPCQTGTKNAKLLPCNSRNMNLYYQYHSDVHTLSHLTCKQTTGSRPVKGAVNEHRKTHALRIEHMQSLQINQETAE
jgi:hypothetical protein